MPPQAGEHVLSTLYVDIHCVFSPVGQRPVHDRFEKSSYFYLHYNASSGHGRIEVANNPGTQDQDAFEGLLENVCITYSYKRPATASISFLRSDDRQWQVRAFDPRQDRQYMYPLQSADLYFWTSEDAQEMIASLKTIPRLGRLDIQDGPVDTQGGHQEPLSPVVQQLERAAISSPYGHRTASGSTAQSFPPPPPPLGHQQQPTQASPHDFPAPQAAQSYQPVPAYNPAAPSAPEPRSHREKTPPPVDADTGTGLSSAPHHDQATAHGPIGGYSPFTRLNHQQSNSIPSQPQSPYSQTFSPPPPVNAHQPGPPSHYATSFASPPISPPATQQHFHSPAPPYASQPTSPAFAPPQAQAFPPPPPQAQAYNPHNPQHNPQASFSSQPPPSPGYSPQYHQQAQQPAHNPYHYAQFSYEKNTPIPGGLQPGDIHSQVYRPTEEEASKHAKNEKASQKNAEKEKSFSGKVDKLDKGVNKFLKKWDKKLG